MEQIDLLKRAIGNKQFRVQSGAIVQFSAYQKLLLEWNSRINLISRSDEERIITRHFIQSIGLLKIVKFPMNSMVMDLGSGAGFPGIPIKLIRPDIQMVLAESVKKKALFLKEIIHGLHLHGIQVHTDRIDENRFLIDQVDFVVARAVANLSDLVRWSFPSLKPNGKLVAIKGIKAQEEVGELRKASKLYNYNISIIPYNPFPEIFSLKESFIVVIER